MAVASESYAPSVLVSTEGLPEKDWLEYRRRGIGGSDAAAILGISPFATARDLYYDKLKIVPFDGSESNWVAKKMGHLLEDLVAEIFHVKTGYRIYQIKKMFYHPVHTFMLADIDYFVELPGGRTAILEIKTTNYDDLEAVIDDMLLQGKIINSNGNYYLVKTFAQEDETARSIARLLCRPVERVDVQDLLTRVRRQLGVELSLRQTEAVHMVFRSDLSVITGSPGTGKTTVLKAVIEVFKLLKPSENILLAAPTGRASRRMAESTGVNNASTLHSLLGLFGEDGGFRKGEEDTPHFKPSISTVRTCGPY